MLLIALHAIGLLIKRLVVSRFNTLRHDKSLFFLVIHRVSDQRDHWPLTVRSAKH